MGITKIQWTERSWNPITGCSKASAGCQNCYAEAMARRLKGMGVKRYENGFKVTMHPDALDEPKKVKQPSFFFVCSMSDMFHDDVPFDFVDQIIGVIEDCPQHTFQLLTKRPWRMLEYFNGHRGRKVPDNVWLGCTVENSYMLPRLFSLKSVAKPPVRFISCEPLLDDIANSDLFDLRGIDWVIVGGESGPCARPMSKEWVLNIKKKCEEAGVPFFFKQWGTHGEDGVRRSKEENGCLLDGIEYKQTPEEWKKREIIEPGR